MPPIWGSAGRDSTLDIIVFSKDRACQLDALLRSMREFFHFPHRICILYTTSTAEFEQGYDLVRRWHQGMEWINDVGTFGITMKNLMARIAEGPGRYLMFLVDDMMFTREFTAQGLMESLDTDEDILAVSLRMGESITYCYTRNCKTTPPDFSDGYRWVWKTASPGYWNYPMSQDAHIFRTSDFAELIPRLSFMSPNTLEATQSGKAFPRPDMVCERTASVINVAANRVQSIYKNRCGNISAEFLHDSFMQGLAIDVRLFAGEVYNACHIGVDLPLIDDERSRKPLEIQQISKKGKPHSRIDLRDIPIFVLNCPADVEKKAFMKDQLDGLDLNYEFVRGQRVKPGWIGVALGHLKILRLSRAKPPFLVLEDDCLFNQRFRHIVEVPAEADALYLGVSGFGLLKPGEIGWGKPRKVQWQRHDRHYLRVFNMLARHAVLYLDDDFCQAVIESQVEALTNRNFPHPGDIGLASLHPRFTILAPEKTVCRQTDRDITDIDLAKNMPENEIKPVKRVPQPLAICLVSHKYRFVFFPISKNASSTLNTEFKNPLYDCEQVRADQLPEAITRNYFKFAFLRDPVTRVCSAYQEISLRFGRGDIQKQGKSFFDMADTPVRFDAFVGQIGDGNWDAHLRAQTQFFDGIELDFCGRLESLKADLQIVCDKLGMDSIPNLPMRRSRKSRKKEYDYDLYTIGLRDLNQKLVDRIRKIYRADFKFIQASCPKPPLQSLLDAHELSSQTRAAAILEEEELPTLALFSRVNQSHENCIVYQFGDRGFFAELTTVARAMIYAWVQGYQLLLDSTESAWSYDQGWGDYFDSFCLTSADVAPARIKQRFKFVLRQDNSGFQKLRSFQPESMDFGNTRLSDFQQILGFFTRMIFRPQSDTQATIDRKIQKLALPEEFDAVHIRRGDKVGDEDIFYPVEAYMQRLSPMPDNHALFVMSDDYAAVEEVREYLEKKKLKVRVLTLCEPGATGFDVWKLRRGESFMGENSQTQDSTTRSAYTLAQTRQLIAETAIAAKSQRFVSTWASNVGRTVWYVHDAPESCELLRRVDIDPHTGSNQLRPSPASLIARYRQINEGFEECVLYSLDRRGFFAEFSTVARAMLYALSHKRQLLLDSESFAWTSEHGWTDYFEPFCLTEKDVNPDRIKERISFRDKKSFSRLRWFEPKKFRFGHTRIEGFFEILGFFMRMIFRPNQACQNRIDELIAGLALPARFDAIHVRRGDKIGDEDVLFPASDYLSVLEPIPDNGSLFVMTDDFAAVNEVAECLRKANRKVNMATLCRSDQGGFSQGGLRAKKRFISKEGEATEGSYENYVFDQVTRLLAEMTLALKSRNFVSTKGTNIAWAVWMMHAHRDCCHVMHASSLDPRPDKPPARSPKKYHAEIQLRGGHIHDLDLPASSSVLKQLQQLKKLKDTTENTTFGSANSLFLQLPVDGGITALSFATADICNLRLIPAAEHPADRKKRGKLPSDFKKPATPTVSDDKNNEWAHALADWASKKLGVASVLYLRRGMEQSSSVFDRKKFRILEIMHDFRSGPVVPKHDEQEAWDLGWCCDFAGFVEEPFTHNFLASLSAAGKYIFFTFSPAHDKRPGIVNRKGKDYWKNKLERLGYDLDEDLTTQAQQLTSGSLFSHTGMVFARRVSRPGSAQNISSPGNKASHDLSQPLPINPMEIARINGHAFNLFLDIFVHPDRSKIVAVLPFYNQDWDAADHLVDVENVELFVGKQRVMGAYIPHRLDSWEPCALLDFVDADLADQLRSEDQIEITIKAGPHSRDFTLSTLPEPSRNVVMSLVVQDENRWIHHFLEYYLQCMDVDHILVYDNGTQDQAGLLNILAPYQRAGKVTHIPWDFRWRNIGNPRKMIAQPQQEAHSLNRFANSKWIGFLDVDEFLRIPHKTVPEFIAGFDSADIDGLSFGLRWFGYRGALDFNEVIDPPLTFLECEHDSLGRKRQKFLVSPRRVRFLRLHTLEENSRELQVDDTEIFFHHYRQREGRFQDQEGPKLLHDDYMLRFADQLALDGVHEVVPDKPVTPEQWINHITRAIAEAETGRSKLNEDVLAVPGLCGRLTRHFYNNLCNFRDCRYLEIGSFEGASTTAAVFENEVQAACIDNFTQFHGTREKFLSHVGLFRGRSKIELIEQDCFDLDTSNMGPFDVYLYDGGHTRPSHYKAIKRFVGTLAPYAVVVIDDWNWDRVRLGTQDALRDLEIPVLYRKEIILPESDLVNMPRHPGRHGWWNGICIMLLGQA